MPVGRFSSECVGCRRRLHVLPPWVEGTATRVPDEVGVLADALHLGPWTIICADCHTANEASPYHRFLLPNGSILIAVESNASKPADASERVVRGSRAVRDALLEALGPAITAYADRSSDDRPGRSLDDDRTVLCIALLFAAGVLQVDIDVNSAVVRTRSPPDAPAEGRQLFEAAVGRGAVVVAASIRRLAAAVHAPQALSEARRLVPDIDCPHRPMRPAFARMVASAGQALEQMGPLALPMLAGFAGLSTAARVSMPFRQQWSSTLLRAEAERPVESNAPLLDGSVVSATLDPAAVVTAAQSLAGDSPPDSFWNGEPGRRVRAALKRLLGADAAAQVMRPQLDLRTLDGTPPDLKRATAEWPRIIASLPERLPMASLLRTAREASIEVKAFLLAGLSHVRTSDLERRAAFAVEASKALAFAPNVLLHICDELDLMDQQNETGLEPDLERSLRGGIAEALRTIGQPERALSLWCALETSASTREDLHHAQQGVGSCLRALKRFDEAIQILERVVAEGNLPRRVMATNALARTLIEVGRVRDAHAALDAELTAARAQPIDWAATTQFFSMYAQLCQKIGDAATARAWASEALRSARASGSQADTAAMEALLDGTSSDILQATLDASADPQNMAALALNLAQAQLRVNDRAGAMRTLESTLARVNDAQPVELWVIFTLLAFLAQHNDLNGFGTRLDQAVATLEALLLGIGATSDAELLLEPYESETVLLRSMAVQATLEGIRNAAFLRQTADLVMAPMLTARLRATIPGAEAVTPPALIRLWQETPCVLVQIVATDELLFLVFSQLGDDGKDVISLHKCEVGTRAARRTVNALNTHVKLRLGGGDDLDLDRVPGWMALAAEIQASCKQYCRQWRLVVCPGLLGSLSVSLALPPPWSISFVPSLGTLLALRARRRALPAGLSFLPRRMADFAVWQEGDAEEVISALQGTEPDGRRIAANHDMSYEIALGRDATAATLMDILRRSDLVRLACHGRIEAKPESFELMVAADGELPPAELIARGSDVALPHRLEQRALSALQGVASYILSSACCSGAATLSGGGERIGLERALFLGGAVAVCAPQWDVHAGQMRDQLAVLLDIWLGNDAAGLDVAAAQTTLIGTDNGILPGVSRALAVFGDGLGRADEVNLVMVVGSVEDRNMVPPPVKFVRYDLKGVFDGSFIRKSSGGAFRKAPRRGRPKGSK